MAEYLSPAIFIEEPSSGVRPIEGVGTSTAAFVGHTVKGPIGVATPVGNFAQFTDIFGGFTDDGMLAFAVKCFFDEGGTYCYVARTCNYSAMPPKVPVAVASSASDKAAGWAVATPATLDVKASSPGEWGNDLSILLTTTGADEFTIEVRLQGARAETFEKLTMTQTDPNYVVTRINDAPPGKRSKLIQVTDNTTTFGLNLANRQPQPIATPLALGSGTSGLVSGGAAVGDYIGYPGVGNGLLAFDAITGINLVAIPDAISRDVHVGGVTYCAGRGDCVYLADSHELPSSADDVIHWKQGDGPYSGNAISSKYGAFYTPWIYVFDPRSGGQIEVPPSGAVAGRCAATDAARGVHKAPAGIDDGRLRTALDLRTRFSTADQERLNPRGINLIREFTGVGSVIWGARTTSADPEWRYLNVRRLLIFLEQSIEQSTSWVVFEPNDQSLWNSITRNVAAFLRREWLAGALVGDKEEQAFYVKCDAETNPPESIDLGRVITEIGVAPSRPAEFVVFRIAQYQGAPATA